MLYSVLVYYYTANIEKIFNCAKKKVIRRYTTDCSSLLCFVIAQCAITRNRRIMQPVVYPLITIIYLPITPYEKYRNLPGQ